jgi:hypothetical protein
MEWTKDFKLSKSPILYWDIVGGGGAQAENGREEFDKNEQD